MAKPYDEDDEEESDKPAPSTLDQPQAPKQPILPGMFGYQASSAPAVQLSPEDQKAATDRSNFDVTAARKQALQKFSNDVQNDPTLKNMTEGMLGGGVVGSVENLAAREAGPAMNAIAQKAAPYAEQAMQEVRPAFQKIKKMFQVGDKVFPASNTAEAMKIKEALEASGQVKPNRALINRSGS